MIAWLAQHSADVLNWTTEGPEGKTPYNKVRGKPFQTPLMRFGETCRFKSRSHEPRSTTGDGRRFHTGTLIDRRTGHYMLHGNEGIKFVRTVVWLREANKFDKAELSKVASTPWDLHSPRETEVIFKDKKEEQEDLMREDKIALSRAVYIPTRPREELALLPQPSALTGQWPSWATSIAVLFPRGRSQRLCNTNASQRW